MVIVTNTASGWGGAAYIVFVTNSASGGGV